MLYPGIAPVLELLGHREYVPGDRVRISGIRCLSAERVHQMQETVHGADQQFGKFAHKGRRKVIIGTNTHTTTYILNYTQHTRTP